MINEKNYFPISKDFNSNNSEIIGNLYEGIKDRKGIR